MSEDAVRASGIQHVHRWAYNARTNDLHCDRCPDRIPMHHLLPEGLRAARPSGDAPPNLAKLIRDWRERAADPPKDWVSTIHECCREEILGCASDLEEELTDRASGDAEALEQAFTALAFAEGALMDAAGNEDGLDGQAALKVWKMVREALKANSRAMLPIPPEDVLGPSNLARVRAGDAEAPSVTSELLKVLKDVLEADYETSDGDYGNVERGLERADYELLARVKALIAKAEGT